MATAKRAAPVKVAAKKVAPVKVALPKTPKAKAEAPKFKAPKTLAAAADRVYTVKEERMTEQRKLAKIIEPLAAEEAFLREFLIEKLPIDDATGVAGKLCRVTIKKGTAPQADNWDKIYEYIVDQVIAARKKKSPMPYAIFALLGRSLSSETVKEMWANGVAIPGVGKFNTKSLSINKS